MTMFASKFAPKPTTTQAKAPRAKTSKPVVQPEAMQRTSVFDEVDSILSVQLPSPVRLLIATIAGLFAYAGSIYWAAAAINYLTAAVVAFTGSAFLGFVATVITWFFAVVGSLRIGYTVAKFVIGFKPSDVADTGRGIKARVTGWFSAKAKDVQDVEAEYTAYQAWKTAQGGAA